MKDTTDVVGALGRPSETTKASVCDAGGSARRRDGVQAMRKVTRFLRSLKQLGAKFQRYDLIRCRQTRRATCRNAVEGLWRTLGRDLVNAAKDGKQVIVETSRGVIHVTDKPPVLAGTAKASAPMVDGDLPPGIKVTEDGWFVRAQATDVPAHAPAESLEDEALLAPAPTPLRARTNSYLNLDEVDSKLLRAAVFLNHSSSDTHQRYRLAYVNPKHEEHIGSCATCGTFRVVCNCLETMTGPVFIPEFCLKDIAVEGKPEKQGEREDTTGLGESANDLDVPIDNMWELDVLYQKMKTCRHKTQQFDRAVTLLYESRSAKEAALAIRPVPEVFLDDCDFYESIACAFLYGLFRYSLGLSNGQPTVFSKSLVDDQMEQMFGSLDSDNRVFDSEDHEASASLLFSCYLARKIWSPIPWRKFENALDGFLTRTTRSEIEDDVDVDALSVACLVLEIIMRFGPKPETFRETEPNSDSACIELSKRDGGKREAMYGSGRGSLGFKYVIPKAIYTGGKIRVITISSYSSSRYLWVNKWLGACLRRLDCSIFGGDVEDWWKRVRDRFVTKPGEKYVSGDLESATDFFDSRISNVLIDKICKKAGIGPRAAEDMKAFTTSCKFKLGKDLLPQNRGNMMGSEISFPLLCIFSITAYICKNDSLRNRLFKLNMTDKRECFNELSALRLGFNGDDVVFPAADAESWIRGVRAIGGVVSRGKSLVNPYFFTVNSELWCSSGQLFCARPSFLTALNDGRKYFISPTREFLEYANSPLFFDSTVFDIERRLNLDIPVRWGGLGLSRNFDPYRAALAKLKSEHDRNEAKKAVWKGSERAIADGARIREELRSHGKKVLVSMSRDMRSAFRRVFVSKGASWTEKQKRSYDPNLASAARFLSQPDTEGRRLLYREWKKLMVKSDRVVMELPAGLAQVYRCQLLCSQVEFAVAAPNKGYGSQSSRSQFPFLPRRRSRD